MKKKSLLLVLALVLVVSTVVGTTLAWLTATSGDVTNTFTVGDIEIELKEHELKNGVLDTSSKVDKNTYTIVPGGSQDKDPFVTVKSGSEKCYVYVKVENNMVIGTDTVVTTNINTTDWVAVETSGNATLYRYKEVVDATSADVTKTVFTKVNYDGEKITSDNIDSLKNLTIKLTAYAHQSENTTQTVADTAAKAWAFPAPVTEPET